MFVLLKLCRSKECCCGCCPKVRPVLLHLCDNVCVLVSELFMLKTTTQRRSRGKKTCQIRTEWTRDNDFCLCVSVCNEYMHFCFFASFLRSCLSLTLGKLLTTFALFCFVSSHPRSRVNVLVRTCVSVCVCGMSVCPGLGVCVSSKWVR